MAIVVAEDVIMVITSSRRDGERCVERIEVSASVSMSAGR